MARVDGSLARSLDFGETAGSTAGREGSGGRAMLRLAPAMRLTGPGKYKVLDARRRGAQIRARRLLDLMEREERTR